MNFTNNSEKLKNVYIESIKKRVFLLLSSFIVVLIPIWFILHDDQYRSSVILITLVIGSISGLLGILFSLKIIKKYYLSYQISIKENEIIITNNTKDKTIYNNKIKKIAENKNGEIIIYFDKNQKEIISKYLNDRAELLNILQNIKSIQLEKNYELLINILPFVFFGIYQLGRINPNKYYYLVTGIGFIITTTIYLIKSALTNYKKISMYINLIFYGYIVFLVSKYMVNLLLSL